MHNFSFLKQINKCKKACQTFIWQGFLGQFDSDILLGFKKIASLFDKTKRIDRLPFYKTYASWSVWLNF
ncbi:hypothetical protein [Moraxella marmotae]|uniref:hypothetical protein n=1 Tax=Moraxella marmotae TaxID=3344520 RepID=UPI0035F24E3D